MQPPPFVTHPFLNVPHAVFVVAVIGAFEQGTKLQKLAEFKSHPESHALQSVSLIARAHVLETHFVDVAEFQAQGLPSGS